MRRWFNSRSYITVSINTTEDCNLACRYCYEINKHRKTMNIETVKKFIDLMLTDSDPILIDENCAYSKNRDFYNGVTLDLIGGDALMKPKLCDEILTYFTKQLWTIDNEVTRKWRKNWICSISTNGTLFSNPEVRKFCEKWQKVLQIGISIDGCPTLQNYNRPFIDGKGSMDAVLENLKWYQKMFPGGGCSTKATMDRTSIPYIFESLKFMYNELGIKFIHQNFIMEENHCTIEDYKEYARQIGKCIDWILETPGVDQDLYWGVLDRSVFANHHAPIEKEWSTKGWCGGGGMPALSIAGGIYPCFRFLPHTQESEGVMKCGSVTEGLNHKENFKEVGNKAIRSVCTKKEECRTCIYESSCAYCIGGCYQEFGEARRTTYICTIAKIQCEMAKRYWNRYNEKHNIKERYEEYELPV